MVRVAERLEGAIGSFSVRRLNSNLNVDDWLPAERNRRAADVFDRRGEPSQALGDLSLSFGVLLRPPSLGI